MTTTEIAHKLIELCRAGNNMEAYTTLYSPDITSIESEGMEPREAHGMDAILAKAQAWMEMFETPATMWCDEPIISGNVFACKMGFAGTGKDGKEIKGEEIAVYTVKDGKIIKEQFFW